MSYKSNRIIVSMIAGAVMFALYLITAMGNSAPAQDDLKEWAMLILTFVVITIVAIIVIQIVFHIIYSIGVTVKSDENDVEMIERLIESSLADDEMDKLIESRSNSVGSSFVGLGFIVMLLGYAFFDMSAVLALNVVFSFFVIGAIVQGCVQVYFYERGIRNG